MAKRSIIFICTHNSSRSQMAEGLMRHHYGMRYNVFSAGTQPGGVNPFAVEAMKAIDIDISDHTSDNVDDFDPSTIDFAVTVCDSARDECPYFPARQMTVHHSFSDPSAVTGERAVKLAAFVEVRDQIEHWLTSEFVPSIESTDV